MAGCMTIRVHGDETSVLQKAWVNASACTWKVVRDFVNHIVFKPLETLVHGQVVHGGRRLARINGAAHHGHAEWRFFAA